MRRVILLCLVVALMLVMLAPSAFANRLGPCNDGNDDGLVVATGATGANYAKHHITEFAKDGDLGAGGHKPGGHMGFSACNPSGK